MKQSNERRTEKHNFTNAPDKLSIVNLLNDNFQKVEEWARKVPSNHNDAVDLDAHSELIAEGVRLLDSRDEQIATRPPTAVSLPHVQEKPSLQLQHPHQHYHHRKGADPPLLLRGHQISSPYLHNGLGKLFRDSNMTAKNYVKEFEEKVNQKNTIFQELPLLKPKSRKKSQIMSSSIHANRITFPKITSSNNPKQANTKKISTVADTWRYKAGRSVSFSTKYSGAFGQRRNGGEVAPKEFLPSALVNETWTDNKYENDRDWWKWKLRQRVLANDELLQKLVSQRRKIESTFLHPFGSSRAKANKKENGYTPVPVGYGYGLPSILPSLSPFSRDASRHVTVEFQSPPKLKRNFSGSSTLMRRTDPIPQFYSASKLLLDLVAENTSEGFIKAVRPNDGDDTDSDFESLKGKKQYQHQQLKTLEKDPYLTKLLAGKDLFKPEMMLDVAQANSEVLTHQHKNKHGKQSDKISTKRKISLQSLSDSTDDDDDNFAASEFFHPDVKVLYERLSELDTAIKNKIQKSGNDAGLSREPSDGFLNLPILLATGRFNRYSKLPSMKVLTNEPKSKKDNYIDKKIATEKNFKLNQSISNKMRKENFSPSKMRSISRENLMSMDSRSTHPQTFGKSKAMARNKPENNVTTQNWAQRLMKKMNQRQNLLASNRYSRPGNNDDDDDAENLKFSDSDGNDEKELGGKNSDTRRDVDRQFINDKVNSRSTAENLGKSNIRTRSTRKPQQLPNIDEDTNQLYHEIVMSKWKKEHNKHDWDTEDKKTAITSLLRGWPAPVANKIEKKIPFFQSQQQTRNASESHHHQHHHPHLRHRHNHINHRESKNRNSQGTKNNKIANDAVPNKDKDTSINESFYNNVNARTKPKGLDAWLENIRDRARARLIPSETEKNVVGLWSWDKGERFR